MRIIALLLWVWVWGWGWGWAEEASWKELSKGVTEAQAVLLHPDNPQVIYLGSQKGLWRTEDGGNNWRQLVSLKVQAKGVNFLILDPVDQNRLYAATGCGLFYTPDRGDSWKRIFRGKGYLESDCTCIILFENQIYLGTKAGLFISKDRGRSWQRASGKVGSNAALALAQDATTRYLYIACAAGVFRSNDAGFSWQRIFVAHQGKDSQNGEEDDAREEKERPLVRYISVWGAVLYLGTDHGVYESRDNGGHWMRLADFGLLRRQIEFLTVSAANRLYAVNSSGIFEFRDARWRELSFTLSGGKINFLAIDKEGKIYAACQRGLFKTDSSDNISFSGIYLYCQNEPDIRAVQQAAIQYAEVEPEKIMRWRRQAALKAWLPTLSADVGRDAGDLWHWETGSSTKNGDDVLVKGKDNLEWDVTLSWDLGEIIWNNDQTSIDVRSRLMVELREDILDEVTKLYFERLRLKMELDNLRLEERPKRLEKELRLREVTAQLDAFTGGYFSAQLNSS